MKNSPSAFVGSRQNLALLPEATTGDATKGGYLVAEEEGASITLMASGSEVELALHVRDALNKKGLKANVASIPCFDLFIEQESEYINSIIKQDTKKIAIEAARGMEWYKLADEVIAMNSFGASAPADKLFEKFGFSVEAIIKSI
jgi:transketolase